MNMSNESFNKLLTFISLIFVMIMYSWAFVVNKPLDLTGILAFLVPLASHATHLALKKGESNA